MKLYIFNPDTDLALANNSENYIPSARVKQMERELAMLPMWYAEQGSNILISTYPDEYFLEKTHKLLGIEMNFITEEKLHLLSPDTEICPWGWNPTLRKKLLNKGVASTLLPDGAWMKNYRELADRANSVEALNKMCDKNQFSAEVLYDIDSCRRYSFTHPRCIFKSPWSGSGKGLLWCFGKYDDKSDGWCSRVLREHRHLIATPIYNKCLDLAMEYYSDGKGNISFVGYSLFHTNSKGAYNSNLLQTDAMHRETLSQYIPLETLDATDIQLQEMLSYSYKNYKGYLGVDMMVCRTENNEYALHPCVEINMRINMGVVSAAIANRYIAEGKQARYTIEYYPTAEALQKEYHRLSNEHPLTIKSNRIVSGFLPLTPVGENNNYMAYILAK